MGKSVGVTGLETCGRGGTDRSTYAEGLGVLSIHVAVELDGKGSDDLLASSPICNIAEANPSAPAKD